MAGRRCAHVRASGAPCGGYAIAGSLRCFAHDPASAAERDAARRRGGRAGRPATLPDSAAPLRSMADVVALTEQLVNHLLAGRLDPKVATAAGYLLGIGAKAIGQADLEARLAALEAVLEPERAGAAALRRGA